MSQTIVKFGFVHATLLDSIPDVHNSNPLGKIPETKEDHIPKAFPAQKNHLEESLFPPFPLVKALQNWSFQ